LVAFFFEDLRADFFLVAISWYLLNERRLCRKPPAKLLYNSLFTAVLLVLLCYYFEVSAMKRLLTTLSTLPSTEINGKHLFDVRLPGNASRIGFESDHHHT
jgi:hypothetical protein